MMMSAIIFHSKMYIGSFFVVVAGICSSIPYCWLTLKDMQQLHGIKLIKPYCVQGPILCLIFNKWMLRDLLLPFCFGELIPSLHSPVLCRNEVGCWEKLGWHEHLVSPLQSLLHNPVQ